MRADLLSRSGILYSPASLEFRLLGFCHRAERVHRLQVEQANFGVLTLLANLVAASAPGSIDGSSAANAIREHADRFQEGMHLFVQGTTGTQLANQPEVLEKIRKTKQFLKNTVDSEQRFDSLDSIMQSFVHSQSEEKN